MDLLKTQLERIQKQLAGLTASQKMLVAALAAIMVITVVWWGKYAGEAEMVPLLNQSFSANDLGPIQDRLTSKEIPFSVSGDKLLVAADRRMEALADLTYSRLMPHNTQTGFDEIVKEMNAFDSQDKQQKIWNHGKEAALSEIIGRWPGVAQADVIIDATNQQRVEGSTEPSATVNISMQDGAKGGQRLVDAAADAVSGAVAALKTSHIKVVVDGRAQRVHDSQDALANGSDQLTLLQQNEAAAERKIRDSFGDIPNILVAVTEKLNTSTVQSEKHEVDPKKSFTKTIQSNTETDQTNGPAAGGEAGAVSNTGVSVGGGGSAGVTQVHEKTEEKSQLVTSDERTISTTPAGDATPLSATVRFPLSHFAKLFQWQTGSTQMPTSAQLQPVIDEELKKLRQMVADSLGMATTDKISVYAYVDTFPTLAAPPVASTSAAGLSLMVGGHAKEIALGTLAVMSLFMASMMVRKASPGPLPAAAAAAAAAVATSKPDPAAMVISAGEALAGEAADGEGHLEGMELSDDSVKAGRMVDQVSNFVREDPETAAALVKKWLGRV